MALDAKPDASAEDLAQLQRLLDIGRKYVNHILGVVIVVLLVILGTNLWRKHQTSRAEEASQRLFASRTTQELQAIYDQYKTTAAAPLALLRLAKMKFDAAEYGPALADYEAFLAGYPEHAFVPVAELGIVHCREALGNIQEALKGFEDFRARRADHALAAEAELGRARCLEQLGDLENARIAYENIMAERAGTDWAALAEEYKKTLGRSPGRVDRGGVVDAATNAVDALSVIPLAPVAQPVALAPPLAPADSPEVPAAAVPEVPVPVTPAEPAP